MVTVETLSRLSTVVAQTVRLVDHADPAECDCGIGLDENGDHQPGCTYETVTMVYDACLFACGSSRKGATEALAAARKVIDDARETLGPVCKWCNDHPADGDTCCAACRERNAAHCGSRFLGKMAEILGPDTAIDADELMEDLRG